MYRSFDLYLCLLDLKISAFSNGKLKNIQVKSPDVVVFQIGENVSYEDITVYGDVFFTRYRELVEGFKDSKRVVCIPFWPVKEKINIITDVAFSTGSRICDLSHLRSGIAPENFASSYKNTDSRESVLILAIQEWTESQKYSVRFF